MSYFLPSQMNFTLFKSEKKTFKIVGKQKIGVVKGEKISKAIYDFLSSPKKRTKKRKNLTREPFFLFFGRIEEIIN